MQNPFPVHHSPRVCNNKMKHTDLCYFYLQLTWLDWSRSRSWSRSFWFRSHNRFLVSVSVSISVSHSLVSVLALVSLCSGLINKPALWLSVCLSVCPSVCPSVKRVICNKTKESCARILITHKRQFTLVLQRELLYVSDAAKLWGICNTLQALSSIF